MGQPVAGAIQDCDPLAKGSDDARGKLLYKARRFGWIIPEYPSQTFGYATPVVPRMKTGRTFGDRREKRIAAYRHF